MKNNKTLLPYLFYHTPPPFVNPQSSVSALHIKPFQNFLKIERVIAPPARLGSVGSGVYPASPLFAYILPLQKRPYKKQALYTSIQAYKNT